MSSQLDFGKLASHKYEGAIVPSRKLQKVTDEDLLELFNRLKGNWYLVDDLQKIIGGVIPVNTQNPKRSPIGSGYLKRLTKLTGEKWRQKTGATPDGKRLVKVFTVSKTKG